MSDGHVDRDERAEHIELELLIDAIRRRWQHDFGGYARAPLRRRVGQLVRRRGLSSISALQALVLRDASVWAEVLDAMTIHVSELFRDPPWWAGVRREVLPRLATHPSIRIWVAGCSRGEEVWSLLVLLDEAGLLARSLVYATDIAPDALRAAEQGIYPTAGMAAASRRYREGGGTGSLADHCVAAYDHVVFDRRLRERVVFAEHSLATDAVFAETQFVSCRNVLIWFDRPLRDRALGLFAQSLPPGGMLGTGARESLHGSALAACFEPLHGAPQVWSRTLTATLSADAAPLTPDAYRAGAPG
jgi:chemotaxis protein methyltransferase CheR